MGTEVGTADRNTPRRISAVHMANSLSSGLLSSSSPAAIVSRAVMMAACAHNANARTHVMGAGLMSAFLSHTYLSREHEFSHKLPSHLVSR